MMTKTITYYYIYFEFTISFQNVYLTFTDREVVLQRQIGSLKNQLDSFRGISFYKR